MTLKHFLRAGMMIIRHIRRTSHASHASHASHDDAIALVKTDLSPYIHNHREALMKLVQTEWKPFFGTCNGDGDANENVKTYLQTLWAREPQVSCEQVLRWAIEAELFDNFTADYADLSPVFEIVQARRSYDLEDSDDSDDSDEIVRMIKDALYTFVVLNNESWNHWDPTQDLAFVMHILCLSQTIVPISKLLATVFPTLCSSLHSPYSQQTQIE